MEVLLALTYSFYCDIEIDHETMKTIISGELENHQTPVDKFLVVPYGISVGHYTTEMIEAPFGFKPKFGTVLRLDKFAPDDMAVQKMLSIVFKLLEKYMISNAALLFDSEIPILAVSQGILQLNTSRGFWMDSRLSLVKTAYETKVIPVL